MTDAATPRADAPEALRTRDGLTLRVREWRCSAPTAVVVLVHGFCASASDPSIVRQAEALCAAGFDVVCYDSRGHGNSPGLCTLGDCERHDVAAAVERAAGRALRVVAVGASMGAIAVLRFAAEASSASRPPPLAGVVAVSSPARWNARLSPSSLAAVALTQTPIGRLFARHRLHVRLSPTWSAAPPPTSLVERIEVPVALVHGKADHFIGSSNSTELYAHCRGPRRLDLVAGMGHAFDESGVEPVITAVEWLLSTPAAPRR